jgi:hypothetical protein
MKPQFPLYIPSKGRFEYMITSKALTEMGVFHNIVVEPHEVQKYKDAVKQFGLLTNVIELDMSYKSKYELCDSLGLSKTTGSGPARNFIWDHSIKSGYPWHWIMDDNIKGFLRMNRNVRIQTTSPSFWRAMEDFVLRYKNVAMAGPNYAMFAFGASALPPFITNTRIYSCNLIRNDVPFRWRGRYNEDTIMSLDMLKAGWCTIQFNAFLQQKLRTQTIKGGNTDELYKDGTMDKSRMLVREHPDVAEVKFKFGRWHHHVNYTVFKKQKLIKRNELDLKKGVNDYGMKLVKLKRK